MLNAIRDELSSMSFRRNDICYAFGDASVHAKVNPLLDHEKARERRHGL